MRILCIGASGFIGPHLVAMLEREGHEIAVFHRSISANSTTLPKIERCSSKGHAELH